MTNAEMRSLISKLSASAPQKRPRFMQSGVHYRSLCSTCNNERLSRHDRVLHALTEPLSRALRSGLVLPTELSFTTQPQAVLRCVAGHLLAVDANRAPEGTIPTALAAYFLDESKSFPTADVACFYWLYPYDDQVLARDAGYVDVLGGGRPYMFLLMKFYPLAFLFTTAPRPRFPVHFAMRCLSDTSSTSVSDEEEIKVDLFGIPPQRWPEAPTNGGAVLHGGAPVHAAPRRRR